MTFAATEKKNVAAYKKNKKKLAGHPSTELLDGLIHGTHTLLHHTLWKDNMQNLLPCKLSMYLLM